MSDKIEYVPLSANSVTQRLLAQLEEDRRKVFDAFCGNPPIDLRPGAINKVERRER